MDTIVSVKDRRKILLPFPTLITQICKQWMLEDDRVRLFMKVFIVTSSLTANWLDTGYVIRAYCYCIFISSELKDEDDWYFNQETPKDNRTFMKLIWDGLRKPTCWWKGKRRRALLVSLALEEQYRRVVEVKEGDMHDGEYLIF